MLFKADPHPRRSLRRLVVKRSPPPPKRGRGVGGEGKLLPAGVPHSRKGASRSRFCSCSTSLGKQSVKTIFSPFLGVNAASVGSKSFNRVVERSPRLSRRQSPASAGKPGKGCPQQKPATKSPEPSEARLEKPLPAGEGLGEGKSFRRRGQQKPVLFLLNCPRQTKR